LVFLLQLFHKKRAVFRSSGELQVKDFMGNFSIRTSDDAQKRFGQIHEKLGFKNKGQTFEALVFRASQEEESTPQKLKTIEEKLDYVVDWTREPT
jgi:hypothetical protein